MQRLMLAGQRKSLDEIVEETAEDVFEAAANAALDSTNALYAPMPVDTPVLHIEKNVEGVVRETRVDAHNRRWYNVEFPSLPSNWRFQDVRPWELEIIPCGSGVSASTNVGN